MKFFEDMSEVPVAGPDSDAFSDSVSIAPAASDSVESSTELSLLSKQDQSPVPCGDSYRTLQSPLPLLQSWPAGELSSTLNESIQKGTKCPKKANRSKGIRKVEVEKKKVIKQMRNRISAQKSRDRKRKELDDLREVADKLRSENSELKSKLDLLQKVVDALPKSQLEKFQADLAPTRTTHRRTDEAKAAKSKKCPLLLATLLIGCFCFAACLSPMMKQHGEEGVSTAIGPETVTVQEKESTLSSVRYC